MEQMLSLFERIITSLSKLWSFLTSDVKIFYYIDLYLPSSIKPVVFKFLPPGFLELNFLTLISSTFIMFLLVWSLIKLFTNVI